MSWGGQGQGQGWGNNQQGQGQQGWGQGQQGQGWGQQPNQNQGWGQQPNQNQGWGQQPNQNQGWGQQPNQNQGFGQQQQQPFGQQQQPFGQQQQPFGQQQQPFGQQNFGGGFVPIPNQKYKILLAQRQHMALDASCDQNSKYKLIVWGSHGGANQQWTFSPDGQGNYSIISAAFNGTLQIPDNSGGQKGTQLHVSAPNNTINEKWKVEQVKGGYAIKSALNGLTFNVLGGNTNNGDRVGIYQFGNAANDTWNIVPV